LARAEVETQLGSDGRILIRPSGTEPLLRVMVEARDDDLADRAARRLVDAIAA
jgi:phosphoglucosamine mutase